MLRALVRKLDLVELEIVPGEGQRPTGSGVVLVPEAASALLWICWVNCPSLKKYNKARNSKRASANVTSGRLAIEGSFQVNNSGGDA
jgi:hypothetical protein